MFDITPSPWEVKSGGQPGEYFISGVAHEQSEWIDEGYDISPEEGDRRTDLAGKRDENNRTLIQAAPKLYAAAVDVLTSLSAASLGRCERQKALENLARAVYKANPKLPGRED